MVPDSKAQALFDAAEKKTAVSCLNLSNNNEEAAELFAKAANLFKINKQWEKAAYAFVSAAECFAKVDSNYEAADHFSNAAACFKKFTPLEAIPYLLKAVDILTSEGRLSQASRKKIEIAEIYEEEKMLKEALSSYEDAASFLEGENASHSENRCLLKVASLSIQLEDYVKAIQLLEKVASESLNGLARYSVKNHFLLAGVCCLALGDYVKARRTIENYKNMDPSFSEQRACKFLEDALEACENGDVDQFTSAVYAFDSMSCMDPIMVTLLLKIKIHLKEEEIV